MAQAYDLALMSVTGSTAQTQFSRFGERWDVPIIADSKHIEFYQSWHRSIEGPTTDQWTTIKRNWISFLSATCARPNADLAPHNKKPAVDGEASADDETDVKRFERDCRVRSSVQVATYRVFDCREREAEGWPRQARLIINRACSSTATEPFRTLRANADLGKRRRYQAMWASLVCFLVYCYDNSIDLKNMGLQLAEHIEDGVFDILDDIKAGIMAEEEAAVAALCENMFKGLVPTASENPILWWLTVLVRSAIDPLQELDYISRGCFLMNILPMDLDLPGRIEAIQHYTKVFVLDLAIGMFIQFSRDRGLEILRDLDSADLDWLDDATAQRPSDDDDPRNCDSPAWTIMLEDLKRWALMFLGSRRDIDTVLGEVWKLLSPDRPS
ncbi:hypothetical protein H2200_001725 [Cladophialophora chaetospira]|uniref:Uncharacterized protein n=1 Tax=Cladophialophora chaetospira TaxID=386627 RepID=A0AA38XLF8_9EURO|nr:hypothetical protein H2200_001725 [Cladophialophora chaetospira]